MIKAPDREKIAEIISDIDQADSDGSTYISRKLRNWNTRFCIWPGMSDDGRKHQAALGQRPFPFEGSLDSRVRLSDTIVRDHIAMLTSASFKARVQVQPTESMDLVKRQAAETVLKWFLFQHCLDDLRARCSSPPTTARPTDSPSCKSTGCRPHAPRSRPFPWKTP
jgi:hypothetical protein